MVHPRLRSRVRWPGVGGFPPAGAGVGQTTVVSDGVPPHHRCLPGMGYTGMEISANRIRQSLIK